MTEQSIHEWLKFVSEKANSNGLICFSDSDTISLDFEADVELTLTNENLEKIFTLAKVNQTGNGI